MSFISNVLKSVGNIVGDPVVQTVADIASGGTTAPYFAVYDVATGNPTGAVANAIDAYSTGNFPGGGAQQPAAPIDTAGVVTGTGGDPGSFTSGAGTGTGDFTTSVSNSLIPSLGDGSAFFNPGTNFGDLSQGTTFGAGGSGLSLDGMSAGGMGYSASADPTQQNQSWWQQLNPFTSGTPTGGGGAPNGGIGKVSGALGIAGGLYGLYNGYQMQQLAKQMQNPYTSQYQQQLAQLMANPASYQNTPAYQSQYAAGLQGLQRQMASGGYGGTGAAPGAGGGSGNFSTAVQQYGQNLAQTGVTQQQTTLANLSAGNPYAVMAAQSGNNMTMQSLFGLGMGAKMMGG